jgi:glycosyltransferase involved in cell wall biosynthesis
MAERMTILHVIEAPSWTGAMAQTLELVLGLRARGHRVTLVASPGSVLASRAREEGVDVAEIELRSELNPITVARLAGMVWRRGVDIVHAHRAHAHSLGLLASLVTGRPFVVSRRVSFPPKDNLGSRLKYRSRAVTRIVAVSKAVKDVLVDYGVDPGRVEVIYSGTDAARYSPDLDGNAVRAELGIPAGAPLVGKVANYYHGWKGHDTFLRAASIVASGDPGVRFLLVGDNTDGEKMRAMVRELGPEGRVILAGHRTDVPEILAALDVSVNAPRAGEGLSGAVRESIAVGRPVVATDVGGNRELVRDGETGLLVPPDDHVALAGAIRRLLEDRAFASGLAEAGARYVRENLTIDRMVEATERLYRRILAGRSGRPGR